MISVPAYFSDAQRKATRIAGELAGLKVGAYFPTNDARGLPRHASTILLIDQNTGQLSLDETEQTTLIEAFAFQVGQSQLKPPLASKRLPQMPFSGQA